MSTSLLERPPRRRDPTTAGRFRHTPAMALLAHLDAFRKVLIRSVLAVLAGFLVAMVFIDRIQRFVMTPLHAVIPEGGGIIFTEPGEGFLLQLKLAACTGLLLAMPVVLWQVWRLVTPLLQAPHKRLAILFVVSGTTCFVAGGAFGHFVLFPLTWAFFASFATDYLVFQPRADAVFGLYIRLVAALGLAFQLPTVVMFLARVGVVTPRMLARNVKYAVLVIFIVAAIATPGGDPISQMVMAVPLLALYGISIGVAWLFQPRRGTVA
jgi:sec-independent protein translocase protein TatC